MRIPFSDIDPDYRIEDAWKEFINPVLRDADFKGSGRNFRRIAGEFVQCVNLQGASYGGSFAINIGIQRLAMLGDPDERVTKNSIKEIVKHSSLSYLQILFEKFLKIIEDCIHDESQFPFRHPQKGIFSWKQFFDTRHPHLKNKFVFKRLRLPE